MSFTIWPKDDYKEFWSCKAFIKIFESPSKLDLQKLSSWTNSIALLDANVSNKNTKDGLGIFIAKGIKTSPWEFRTTAPIPASCESSNIAPSKFVLSSSWSRGLQVGLIVQTSLGGSCRAVWNSWSNMIAWSETLPGGNTFPPTMTLFWQFQTA